MIDTDDSAPALHVSPLTPGAVYFVAPRTGVLDDVQLLEVSARFAAVSEQLQVRFVVCPFAVVVVETRLDDATLEELEAAVAECRARAGTEPGHG